MFKGLKYPVVTESGTKLFAFIGGFAGAMTHYIKSVDILYSLDLRELYDFTVHSLIGGAIMLAVKVLSDWILYKIKRPKDGNQDKHE